MKRSIFESTAATADGGRSYSVDRVVIERNVVTETVGASQKQPVTVRTTARESVSMRYDAGLASSRAAVHAANRSSNKR